MFRPARQPPPKLPPRFAPKRFPRAARHTGPRRFSPDLFFFPFSPSLFCFLYESVFGFHQAEMGVLFTFLVLGPRCPLFLVLFFLRRISPAWGVTDAISMPLTFFLGLSLPIDAAPAEFAGTARMGRSFSFLTLFLASATREFLDRIFASGQPYPLYSGHGLKRDWILFVVRAPLCRSSLPPSTAYAHGPFSVAQSLVV